MLGELMKELKGETGSQISNIPGFDTNKLDDVFGIAGDVVAKEAGSQLLGGNTGALTSLFSNNENNSSANDLQGSIEKGIMSKLTSKLGLEQGIASKVVSMLLPSVLDKIKGINSKTPDNDLSPLKSLFGGAADLKDLGGKNMGDLKDLGSKGVGGMLNKLF